MTGPAIFTRQNSLKMNDKGPELSVIIPCLNEEQALGSCLDAAKKAIQKNRLKAEIIVVDNGSTDNSREIAKEKDVILVHEQETGYGLAYLKGFEIAKGKYLFLADADDSYDFGEIARFIAFLENGYDFVIGNRFKGRIEKAAMPWSHKYIGNPILSGISRLFFGTKIHDVHCGMRAITKEALEKLRLKTKGMEFASEMVILAGKKRLKIKELPIDYYRRKGRSKLRSFADGWRHLRFMLLYSPFFLFFIPGTTLLLLGLISMLGIYSGALSFLGIKFQYHPMFLSALFIITGYQLIIFALFAKSYAIIHLGDDPIFNRLYRYVTIEKASIVGIVTVLLGIFIYIKIFLRWTSSGFGALNEVKNSIVALTLIIAGIQTIFSSFMLSILGIKEK